MRHCQRAWHACAALRLWLAMAALTSTPAEKLDGLLNEKGTSQLNAYVGATTGPSPDEGPADSFNINVSRAADDDDLTAPILPHTLRTHRSLRWTARGFRFSSHCMALIALIRRRTSPEWWPQLRRPASGSTCRRTRSIRYVYYNYTVSGASTAYARTYARRHTAARACWQFHLRAAD